MKGQPAHGRCSCDSVTYDAFKPPVEAGACHCGVCRKWTGGCGSLGFQAANVEITRGYVDEIAWWKSSRWGERGFCSKCGTSLFWRLQRGTGSWVVNSGTLKHQAGLQMAMHIYVDEMPGGYDFDDDARRMTGKEFTEMVFSEMSLPVRMVARLMLKFQKPKGGGDAKPDGRKGKCACGAVEVSLDAEPKDAVACQCMLCRRTHGGVAALWAEARGLAFGDESSVARWKDFNGDERCFCRKCGSSLAKFGAGGTDAKVSVAALETAATIPVREKVRTEDVPDYIRLTVG